MTRAPAALARPIAATPSYARAVRSTMTSVARSMPGGTTTACSRSASRRSTVAFAPVLRTASARRVLQIRSSARIATVGVPSVARSAKAGGEVPEHVARGDHARRLAAVDDRHVAEAPDRHLVDRHGNRIAAAQDHGIRGHDLV